MTKRDHFESCYILICTFKDSLTPLQSKADIVTDIRTDIDIVGLPEEEPPDDDDDSDDDNDDDDDGCGI